MVQLVDRFSFTQRYSTEGMQLNLEQFACEVCEETFAKVSIVREDREDSHAADHVA